MTDAEREYMKHHPCLKCTADCDPRNPFCNKYEEYEKKHKELYNERNGYKGECMSGDGGKQ